MANPLEQAPSPLHAPLGVPLTDTTLQQVRRELRAHQQEARRYQEEHNNVEARLSAMVAQVQAVSPEQAWRFWHDQRTVEQAAYTAFAEQQPLRTLETQASTIAASLLEWTTHIAKQWQSMDPRYTYSTDSVLQAAQDPAWLARYPLLQNIRQLQHQQQTIAQGLRLHHDLTTRIQEIAKTEHELARLLEERQRVQTAEASAYARIEEAQKQILAIEQNRKQTERSADIRERSRTLATELTTAPEAPFVVLDQVDHLREQVRTLAQAQMQALRTMQATTHRLQTLEQAMEADPNRPRADMLNQWEVARTAHDTATKQLDEANERAEQIPVLRKRTADAERRLIHLLRTASPTDPLAAVMNYGRFQGQQLKEQCRTEQGQETFIRERLPAILDASGLLPKPETLSRMAEARLLHPSIGTIEQAKKNVEIDIVRVADLRSSLLVGEINASNDERLRLHERPLRETLHGQRVNLPPLWAESAAFLAQRMKQGYLGPSVAGSTLLASIAEQCAEHFETKIRGQNTSPYQTQGYKQLLSQFATLTRQAFAENSYFADLLAQDAARAIQETKLPSCQALLEAAEEQDAQRSWMQDVEHVRTEWQELEERAQAYHDDAKQERFPGSPRLAYAKLVAQCHSIIRTAATLQKQMPPLAQPAPKNWREERVRFLRDMTETHTAVRAQRQKAERFLQMIATRFPEPHDDQDAIHLSQAIGLDLPHPDRLPEHRS
ncbi:MAG: hypothetical protein WCV84_02345 [Patescibacteria group bacterium]